ncbi:HlyC/CorC family transporter [Ectothiorhodospira variabilis]|uniref:HlyC/CorC family transporter n=1 Tax=Ectothiorhodospira variabilis TaxID=505694 RepID=UPI001EFAD12C|nr:HlyC/CorC family transporter [Ectothiorhodospira variabilis]MCG5495818.1 HlyC/CorC family transporter [Ectothiorhodospira variabilis]MCG5498711.1 HlyC/CorC family transporter [Ectothiorhodospira variabilis]MCG5504748.1 HlyC/CorC family transporter [Ectothiorhodospira variabilis]MCG5507905.1 HlyC/CorC family transporter [Ectothiorhodospira variabilis]
MENIPLGALAAVLVVLFICSAFFSGSETALMALNRYRMRHMAQAGHGGARRAQKLLDKPDRLIGLILLGNNFVNILITQLATYIGFRVYGDVGVAVATGLLTLTLLVFAEVAPKTLAALHSDRVAYPAAYVFTPLLVVAYPLVWTVNLVANGVLRAVGVRAENRAHQALSSEELRVAVNEAGSLIPARHQRMLVNLLDLEKATVEDIMVPRNEIVGIDLEDDWEEIEDQIIHSQYTRLPVFKGNVDNMLGFIHLRRVLPMVYRHEFSAAQLRASLREPYFIPQGTNLNRQLLNFQREQRRIGLVVDEYGDIEGLVTLEDLLEEVVGEFTTDPSAVSPEVLPQEDGSYLVDATIHLRELNRILGSRFPVDGPRTLNGMLLEYLETIPDANTSVLIDRYPIEIVHVKSNAIKTVRVSPRLPTRAGGQDSTSP